MAASEEQKWLAAETAEERRLIEKVFSQYDNAMLTLEEAKHQIALITNATASRIYDHAFAEGIQAADLDDSTEEEFDIEFDDEDEN